MSTIFTKSNVLAALERAVALKGEAYTDPKAESGVGCSYTEFDGSPSCIVGHVIADLKPELLPRLHDQEEWVLPEYENEAPYTDNPFGVYTLVKYLGDDFDADKEVQSILAAAQTTQDNGGSWGAALRKARVIAYLKEEEVEND